MNPSVFNEIEGSQTHTWVRVAQGERDRRDRRDRRGVLDKVDALIMQ